MKERFSVELEKNFAIILTECFSCHQGKVKVKEGEQTLLFITMHCTLLEGVDGVVVGCLSNRPTN